eukprot:366239-Chlamydomonas_euryale.AAC.11
MGNGRWAGRREWATGGGQVGHPPLVKDKVRRACVHGEQGWLGENGHSGVEHPGSRVEHPDSDSGVERSGADSEVERSGSDSGVERARGAASGL